MKRLIALALLIVGLFSSVFSANANAQLKTEDVSFIEVQRLSGGSRIFRENDGYEEPVVGKVVKWINEAIPLAGAANGKFKSPAVLKLYMKNEEVAAVEPAYNCSNKNQTTICTLANNEVIYTQNNKSTRLKSVALFDWILAGWKYENTEPPKDSETLIINDILMVLLGDEIDKTVSDYYSKYLTTSPMVYPYMVDIVNVKRIGEFRTFHFLITLEITPVVGPHIAVGEDRLTFEIAPTLPGYVKLKKYEHLETYDLPPNWQHIIKTR